jgi:hypothetical protein
MKSGVSGTTQTSSQSMNRGLQFRQAAFKGEIRELERLFSPDVLDEPGKPSGKTALHLASANGKIGAVKWLLANKARTDLKDKEGNTPFLLALIHHHTKIANYFIEQGAPVTPMSSPSQPAFRVPPLILLGSDTGKVQLKALQRNLPYLKSLGYKGFFSDIFVESNFEEMILFFQHMNMCDANSNGNYREIKDLFEAIKKEGFSYHQIDSTFVSSPDKIFPPPSFNIQSQFKAAEKILSLAEQCDGGIICYLSFNEHPFLVTLLSDKFKEKASQFIFYAEKSSESALHNFQLSLVSLTHNNFHYMNNAGSESAIDIAFREPIVDHFQQHTRDKYYTQTVASSDVLTKLKSLDQKFEELKGAKETFDAVLPVEDIADFKQKSALFSERNMTPKLGMRKHRHNPMQAGTLSLILEDVETPSNREKILGTKL